MDSYDGRIDWEAFYTARVRGAKRSGDKITGFCPFHDNKRTRAWWASLTNGLWKCEAGCGSGNATTFLARAENIDTKAADAMLCELAGVERKAPKAPGGPYDVAAYAASKRLDPTLLARWGLTASRGSVLIPYAPGVEGTAVRKRHRPGASQPFSWLTAKDEAGRTAMVGSLGLYGLWLMDGWEPGAAVVLVEGESDCHALWSLGIPALGVPGAATFRPEWAPALAGRDVLIHDEGDDAARLTFIPGVTAGLRQGGHDGAVRVFATPGEHKDPSALFAKHGPRAGDMLRKAVLAATEAPKAPDGADAPDTSPLAAWGLSCPRGWLVRGDGIYAVSEERGATLVTATPVVMTRRIIDVAGGVERVGLAVLRDGRWRDLTCERETALTSRCIVGLLAPCGANVTSENARHVVRWLGALEAANMDGVPRCLGSAVMGWCGESEFMPCAPGTVVLEADDAHRDLIGAFKAAGDLAQWTAAMAEPRIHGLIFRFVLAASFAAPLLKALGTRGFFVYNWGKSKGGKTAAAKAALSVWGDPDVLMATFNSTEVGLERLATFMSDLPLGIDERQVAAGDQQRLNRTVYALASGTGRVRGARDGGLQATGRWRNVVIATGEEPLSGSTSATGVVTRILELFGSPFTDEGAGAAMHATCAALHGTAGPAYIGHLIAEGPEKVRARYAEIVERLSSFTTSHASSHIAAVATVAVADVLASMWLFGAAEDVAMHDATCMALGIMGAIDEMSAGDVDEAACLWLEGWLRSNEARFVADGRGGPVLGERRGESEWLVYPGVLRCALEDAGFNYRKTLRALTEREALMRQGTTGLGGVTHAALARVHGAPARVIWLDSAMLLGGVLSPEEAKQIPF